MRVYHERLSVPLSWWLLGMTVVLIFSAEVIPLLNEEVVPLVGGSRTVVTMFLTAAVLVILAAGLAAMLVSWGRARIEVTATELRAGPERLPLAAVGNVAQVDEKQARALRGGRADPSAYLLVRPYLRRGVWVEVTDPGLGTPYWLVGSRKPGELAQAISSARPAARADGGAVG